LSTADHDRAVAAVGDVLDELDTLSEEDLLLLAQLWSEEDDDARRRAWQRAKAAIERSGLTDVLDGARADVGSWLKASQSDFHGVLGLLGREGGHVSARQSAAPAVLDAVAAALAEHDLFSEDHAVLSRPWRITLDHDDVPDRPAEPSLG
jgi:hypothetical protein